MWLTASCYAAVSRVCLRTWGKQAYSPSASPQSQGIVHLDSVCFWMSPGIIHYTTERVPVSLKLCKTQIGSNTGMVQISSLVHVRLPLNWHILSSPPAIKILVALGSWHSPMKHHPLSSCDYTFSRDDIAQKHEQSCVFLLEFSEIIS